MTDISSLPPELLLHVFTFLPTSELIRVEEVCPESKQWRDLSRTALKTRIQSSWSNPGYWPSDVEVHCAAALVTTGHLPLEVVTTLATRIQSLWSDVFYWPCVAEVVCAAALAATGLLTSVQFMRLRNLELPSTEDMPSLARVNSWVALDNVTGDIGSLVSSLSCTELEISDMELDQAATSSLVRALQYGVKDLGLSYGVRLHIQTMLEWDGRGRCGQVRCSGDTRYTYREEMKTWAARVNWSVWEGVGCWLGMTRM